jgi:hypothetical protein
VASEKQRIEASQTRLAEALRDHAARRRLIIPSTAAALQLLFKFLEEEQVSLLLGAPSEVMRGSDPNRRESAIVAEFVQDALRDDPALRAVLNQILEGLVLYRAAFLPDLDAQTRNFKGLKVFFDSVLVRQALGYEGPAMATLLRDTIDVLKAAGAGCFVFDKSVSEIKRILAVYEVRMGTDQDRRRLRPGPMARYFLTQRYSPGDIRQMTALLETEIGSLGLQIRQTPRRQPEYTASEQKLAARLADPNRKDELEPRVVHDVDCAAAILTLRGDHRPTTIDAAQAVFVTTSPLVLRNTRLWWDEDEHETGLEPIVDVRALANLAWLKKPRLRGEFKEHELVALCTAALRPRQDTWQRFLRHLDSLERSKKITSNEVSAILVSAMSDQLLRELEDDDPNDVDAATLEEVVERIKESYGASAEAKLRGLTQEHETTIAQLEGKLREQAERATAAERTAADRARQYDLVIEGRARGVARGITMLASYLVSALLFAGAFALVIGHPFHTGWAGSAIGLAVVTFVFLELLGILGHVSEWRSSMEVLLTKRFRDWLGGNKI